MRGTQKVLLTILVVGIAIFTLSKFDKPRGDGFLIESRGDFSCSEIRSMWLGRDGQEAVTLMQENALEAELSEKWSNATCTLELAFDKASGIGDRKLQLAVTRQLASVYIETQSHDDAERILTAGLKLFDQNTTVTRIRRMEMLLQLAEVASETGDVASQEGYLNRARREQTDIDAGLIFREKLYLAEIEFFESQGAYDKATGSAAELLDSRLEWANSMPGNSDTERIKAARIEYARLLRLAGHMERADAIMEKSESRSR